MTSRRSAARGSRIQALSAVPADRTPAALLPAAARTAAAMWPQAAVRTRSLPHQVHRPANRVLERDLCSLDQAELRPRPTRSASGFAQRCRPRSGDDRRRHSAPSARHGRARRPRMARGTPCPTPPDRLQRDRPRILPAPNPRRNTSASATSSSTSKTRVRTSTIVRTVQRAPADVCSPYGGRCSCGAISPVRVRYRRAKRRLDSVANTTRMPRVHSAARTTNHVVE